MLLARKHHRVLLLERASFPSDTIRNHFIQHSGVVQLHRWDLLRMVIASNCPPISTFTTDFGDFPLCEPVEQGDGVDATYAPRRIVLDKLLADAAVAAGAELRERFAVHELLWDDDRVVGIRGRSSGGAMIDEHARIVVGADGAHSVVAKAVKATRYNEHPALTYSYYSSFSDVPMAGIEVCIRPRRTYINFPTNDGLTCVAMQAPVSGFSTFRSDIEGSFYQALDTVPELAERVRAGRRAERWYGTADLTNFFHVPYGPGWALVGDAGFHKDPILAQGISDAFRDAELLASAIDDGLAGRSPLNDALREYEQRCNDLAFPGYAQNLAAASFLPPPPEVIAQRAAAHAAQPSPRPRFHPQPPADT